MQSLPMQFVPIQSLPIDPCNSWTEVLTDVQPVGSLEGPQLAVQQHDIALQA